MFCGRNYDKYIYSTNHNLLVESEEEENKTRMETISEGNRCYIDAAWENTFIGIGIFFHMPMAHNAIFIKRFAPV